MPVRRCVACRQTAAKASLVRVVVSGGAIVVDPVARAPGRGAYLCGRPACTDAALQRDAAALRRALRVGGPRTIVDVDAVRGAVTAARATTFPGERTSGATPTGAASRGVTE